MALDKQKILNELGSVVNQLQSADCGCMGKLFSSPGQAGATMGPACNSMPTCGGYRHGCCHGHGCRYGYNNAPCGGEPCINRCNPPKLYADTYSYLNKNLMQPIVKEVYNDLNSLTPANTIMNNNALAGQMGLPPQGTAANMMAQSNVSGNVVDQSEMLSTGANPNAMQNSNVTGNMINSMPATGTPHQMGAMSGMGPQIVNMMMGDGTAKPTNVPAQSNQLAGQMIIDAPNSPHGQLGVTPLNALTNYNQGYGQISTSQEQYSVENAASPNNMVQGNQISQIPNTQYVSQYGGMNTNTQRNAMSANATGKINPMAQMTNSNPAAQQMAAAHRHPHNLHEAGVTKFNEMFPGVMQGLGGDLGFDPMALAIQMNPANQQKAAIDTMHKMMMNPMAAGKAMTPQIAGTPTPNVQTNVPMTNQTQQNTTPSQYQQSSGNQQIAPAQVAANPTTTAIQPNQLQQQQQVYTTLTGANANQQQIPQQLQGQQYQQRVQQEIVDPNAGGLIGQSNLPTINEGLVANHNIQMQRSANLQELSPETAPPMIKEPIFPADISKNQAASYSKPMKRYEYNTLGQPVEMLPATMYYTPEPNLPQTLSPQSISTKARNDPNIYSNVKSTVSKTSLMGNKPVGKVPSRNQLQRIYNQYKGSQSYTQQNIPEQNQGVSHSEGKLNLQTNPSRQIPVERTGGDTMANNQLINSQTVNKTEPVPEKIGDVPAVNKLETNITPEKVATNNSKYRNGLQDQVYTSYNAASWTFHGHDRDTNYPTYQYRA